MTPLACLNGEILPADEARVPIWDRGFLFGDSIYEVFRLYHGRCWLAAEHWGRLERSLREVEILNVDLDRLRDQLERTIEISGVSEGTAYIQITRGVAPRAHAFPDPQVAPTELIVVREYDDSKMVAARNEGVAVVVRPDFRWGRCDIKSTNLLANVMAFEAAVRAGAKEAVLCNGDNQVTEATHSSLLWVRGGILEASPESEFCNILPGTTRLATVRLADRLGIAFQEAWINPVQLMQADEVFLAGTTIEILPVTTINGIAIRDGQPGPVTKRLQAAFKASLAEWLAINPA